jgi:hypothetical protein
MSAISPPATYVLEQLQSLMVARLAGDSMFGGDQSANGLAVPIITQDIGDPITELQVKIGQLGLCLLVLPALFEFTNEWVSSIGQVSLDGLGLITVNIYEDVVLNQSMTGTQIPAIAAAQRVLALMHGWPTGLPDNPNNPSHFMGTRRPIELVSIGPPLQYAVLFQAHLTLIQPQP